MPTPDTALGPQGSSVYNYYGSDRLQVDATSVVDLVLQQPGGTVAADISGFTSFDVSFRRERNETLTVAPLIEGSAAYTGSGTGTDGAITITVPGGNITQTAIGRGYWDCYGQAADGSRTLLVTGRWECVGGTRYSS